MVQVREGSAEHNLDTLLPLLASGELGDWCLCTDDASGRPGGAGHRCASQARGRNGVAARRCGTLLVPARHYGLRDRGAVAPGFRADVVALDSLADFGVRLVFKDGKCVARDGQYLAETAPRHLEFANTVHLGAVDESAFVLRPSTDRYPVIRIIPHRMVTATEVRDIRRHHGEWVFDPAEDVLLVASLERHRATGRVGVGLVAGFGLTKHGAVGSSVAHDAHNLIIAGSNPRDMLACVKALEEVGGGFVVVANGEVRARLPLPVAGLLSREEVGVVCDALHKVNAAARALGCTLNGPFGYLSFWPCRSSRGASPTRPVRCHGAAVCVGVSFLNGALPQDRPFGRCGRLPGGVAAWRN